jgi:hypothetical protein
MKMVNFKYNKNDYIDINNILDSKPSTECLTDRNVYYKEYD